MAQPHDKYYGIDALKRSFIHFVLGKGFSAFSALAVLIITVREFSSTEFAIYTTLHALVLTIGVLSSFGVNTVLLRYLPDLRGRMNNRAMYRLLFAGIAVRAASYGLLVLALLPLTGILSEVLKIGDWQWALQWYLVVGFFRVNANFTVGTLESLLWQREAQYIMAVSGVVKLILVVSLMWCAALDLRTFLAVEIFVEFMAIALLVIAAVRRWQGDPDRFSGDPAELLKDRGRYVRFAIWNYTQSLTSILYGSSANRLFAAYFLPTEATAVFGVIDRILDYIRRYEPSGIFIGLIRPMFNSRYRQASDFAFLVSLGNLIYRLNVVVLLLPFIAFAVGGDTLFEWITAGKYAGITPLFLGFYAIALLGTASTILDILVKVVEKTEIFTISNLMLSVSIAVAIPLIHEIGLWSLVVANGVGLLLSFGITLWYVKREGFPIVPDWSLIGLLCCYAAGAIALGNLIDYWADSKLLALVASCVFFVLLVTARPPLRNGERARIENLVRSSVKRGSG